ncbi:MAG: AAA family ATPase [Fibrobacter sp.]|jgi:predicted ATP-dependent protease|nr:AAA family ATPase [Fibrobacter sp.]
MTDFQKRFELSPQDAEPSIQYDRLDFSSTDELEPLDEIVGQPRAVRALELGLGIDASGYNIYMSGMSGMGKKAMVKKLLLDKAEKSPVPPDWIYVNNFKQEDRPLAISIEPGKGKELKKDMEELVSRLKEDVPRAFQQEDFSKEKMRLTEQYEYMGKEAFEKLDRMAMEKNLFLQETPDGRIVLIPKKGDRPMSAEEFEALSQQEKDDLSNDQQDVSRMVAEVINRQREIGQKLRDEVRKIERDFASRLISPAIDEIINKYQNEKLQKWLASIKEHMIENLNRFRTRESGQQQALASLIGAVPPDDSFSDYAINVVVDNSELKGAPVIIEESPNYKNLFGTITGTFDRTGRLFTNFLQIKSGSILRANGGYLVFNLMEALIEPLVWKELKSTLKSGELEYHIYDPFGVFSTSSLRPEPIQIKVKLVVVGTPLIYHLLQLYDEDFPELFKVKAEFAPELDQINNPELLIGRFVQSQRKKHSTLSFDPHAVAEIVKIGARLAGEKEKITSELSRVADIIRESDFWARKESAQMVGVQHVRKAVEEKIYRSNLIAEKMRELIANGTLLIGVDGLRIGQANGLSIIQLGDYAFGRPSRITASVGVGAAGIINIERESHLSGSSFDKAILILEGYMRNKYASKHPLSLSASLAMEQSYGLIEGDSATVAELVCLLSAFAGIPLRQDIAITGSVNQWGQIQAVGGVTQKVEGFYEVCKQIGLTGNQGVCIPQSNVRHLVLRHEILDAMRDGRFHIWAVKDVDEAIELLTGTPAGNIDKQDTFHWRVDQRLLEMLDIVKQQKTVSIEREYPAWRIPSEGSRDPRPRFPGEEKC